MSKTSVSISDLRRFLHTGLAQFRRSYSTDGFSEFKTVEMALYLKLTAREALDALDDLRQQNVLSYKGLDEEGFEVWRLTRNGRYVTASGTKAQNKITKAFIGRAMAGLGSVAALGPQFDEVAKVLCHGPWMIGLTYGPTIIGLETRGWQGIAPERRLEMVAAFMKAWCVEKSTVDVVVMGFDRVDGVPERIAAHCLVYDKNGGPKDLAQVKIIGKGGLDRHEASYSQALMQDAKAYGLVHGRVEDEVRSVTWWLIHNGLRYPVEKHFEAKKMLSVEIFTTLNDAACALAPKRRPADVFDTLDEADTRWGKDMLKSLERYHHNERVDVDRLGAEVDDFVERGAFDTIGRKSGQAKLVLSRLAGEAGHAGFESVLLTARATRVSNLEQARQELEKRRTSSGSIPVHYLVLYDIASQDEPRPVGLIRQPGGHTACIRNAMNEYGNQLCRTTLKDTACDWLRSNAGALMTQVRNANDSERDAFDLASELAGCTLRYILLNEDGTVVGGKGAYEQMPVKLGLRIEGLGGADELAFQLDYQHDGLLKDVEKHKATFPNDIRRRVEKWWIDARKTPMRTLLEAMAGHEEDDRRLGRLIDPDGQWRVVKASDSTFSATLRSKEFSVEIVGLGEKSGKSIRIRLKIGDWIREKPLTEKENRHWFAKFTNSCGDIWHVLRGIGWIADVGIDNSYEKLRVEEYHAGEGEEAGPSAHDPVLRLVRLIDHIAEANGPFESRGCEWNSGFTKELAEPVIERV